MQQQDKGTGRRGSSLPPMAPAPDSGERRPSLGSAALASLKGLGAKALAGGGSRRPSRMSLAAPGPTASRRSSAAVLAAASGEHAGDGPSTTDAPSSAGPSPLHPGLNRIKSFNRRHSAFRGGGRAASWDSLCAAMDTLDARVGGALQALREQNAAGLGRVRGLAASKSGRLRLGVAEAAATVVGGGQDDGDEYSPRALLGIEAAERPDKFLPRVKFSFKEGSSAAPLHRSGSSSARGRLEGSAASAEAAVAESGGEQQAGVASCLIAAVHDTPGAGQPAAEEQRQQQETVHIASPAQTQRGGVATPPVRMSGARWGATEGGLDRLGWVRGLVQFSDFRQQQLQLGQAPSPGVTAELGGIMPETQASGMDTIGWLDSGAGLRSQSGAAPATGAGGQGSARAGSVPRREEVALLQAWLQDMMAQVIAQAVGQQQQQAGGDGSIADATTADADAAMLADDCPAAPAEQSASDLADAALWVFGLAFEELQRQVATECADRGTLLGGMWQHAFNLVELRCSLAYEGIIGAIREELAAARHRAAAATAAEQAAEARVRESMYYSRDKYAAMEGEVKHLAQLLATAEEEAARHADETALLRRANEAAAAQRAADQVRLAEELRLRLDLQHDTEELQVAAAERAGVVASQEGELAQLRSDLQRARTDGLALAEDRARLQVEVQRAQREHQTSEIMSLSLREQLAARQAELGELSTRHAALQAEAATASIALLESQASLAGLQMQHEGLQASATERAAQLEEVLADKCAELAEAERQVAATEEARATLDKGLQETAAREAAVAVQLKQLAGAHEQQMSKLRQEAEARRTADDELAAVRAGLQVTQQRLEGLGIVFASSSAHRTAAEAWRATGPISMARQVVAAVNQQLGELAARRAELQHELGASKERWQAEEAVRVRLQEQLLEVRARESKLSKEREGLEGVVARLEVQRAAADAELAQQRRMLEEAEARCQASHRSGMEAANEAKRLAPLEPRAARLEEALRAAGVELERVQHEVTVHQQTIRKLLDEKSTALEQLAARSQALDAAQRQIRELAAAAHDRLQLAEGKEQLEEELHALRQRCSATERLQGESMHQLTVARRLLEDATMADDRAKLATAQQELRSSRASVVAQRRESLLLKDRLAATEGQLQFMERQLHVAVHAPLAAAAAAAAGGGRSGAAQPALVDQLRRLLETKEERIRQLERLQSSLAASTCQFKQLQLELSARDGEVAALQAEVDSTRKRLHAMQAAQAQAATRDLVALAASDLGLPPDVAQALAVDYARSKLRSELAWTKAKLAFVCNMASGLRANLAQALTDRAQAGTSCPGEREMESVCVEAFYLEQGVMDQRSFAAAFDATFVQVKRMLMTAVQGLAELRRQLVAPTAANLPRIEEQVGALAAALSGWSCQADPLAELEAWQRGILDALPAARPTSPPPLQHVSALIVQVYAHRVRQLPLQGPPEPGALVDNVYEAVAEFFCERRGFSREAALSPTGPVAALLAGARSHLQQPKQLLLGRLAGLAPSGGSGSSRSLQHPAAWQFFVRLLCCLRALQGAGWEPLVKKWVESEEGVPLPLQCVMDVLANAYNTDAPALVDSMRHGLLPLVRQGRRGPVLDLDALLLVLMNDYCDGSCPISPLALPRRLTDGALSSATLAGGHSTSALASTVSGVAVAVGASAAYLGGGVAGAPQDTRQKSPMRKRIVNLTATADALPLGGMVLGRASPELAGGGSTSAPGAAATGNRSGQVLSGMRALMESNPALPVGLRSQLRASSPTGGRQAAGD